MCIVRTDRQRGRRIAVAAIALLVLTGTAAGCATPGGADLPVVPSTGAVQSSRPDGSSTSTAAASALPNAVAALPPSEPSTISIPKIGAASSLIPLGLNPDQTVQDPPLSNPMQAGWYINGPTPGEVGPAVILGHVDGNGKAGIFFRLRELRDGDRIEVERRDRALASFTVYRVAQVAKDQFSAAGVYEDTAGPELRVITCGGAFDRTTRNYIDNIIVYARLAA